jgi:hypothetical protein
VDPDSERSDGVEYRGSRPVDAVPEVGLGFGQWQTPSDNGPARIIARAPDPHGSLPWGLGLGPDERRGECVVKRFQIGGM